ncbi:hypothetical protein L2E82_03968 [Cichorium intybus]|uniref:Uncharacterized protein n=1 Tax=Cichorium intybus TaxID=13427 RepID=A0ACB9H5C9_CICIN|nr:hypothetical protein L2E82_03968 [Cichorium intybus]
MWKYDFYFSRTTRLANILIISSTFICASVCAAGDSAAYQRSSNFGDDVVIVAAYRSPLCKSKRGGLKDTYPDDILAPVLKALIEKTNINPAEVGDIVVGSVLGPGSQRASECNMAAFYAGFPETFPIRTVNRQCSSGLQAVPDLAATIKAGFYEIGGETPGYPRYQIWQARHSLSFSRCFSSSHLNGAFQEQKQECASRRVICTMELVSAIITVHSSAGMKVSLVGCVGASAAVVFAPGVVRLSFIGDAGS